mmetsp:Transcript_17449/g.36616  ORF Transcript_17449/g.36616 Transcript_17449/m.36616 type:complete len:450 (+) Transcript_17449:101-1450(+)
MDGATTSTGSSAPGSNGNSGFLNLGTSAGGMGLFGQTTGGSSGGDALLGSSGFNSSLGNAFSNEGGNGQHSGGSANPSFDLNDFPSLGGGVGGNAGSGAAGTENGLAAALRQHHLLQQQMLQQGGGGGGTDSSKSSNLYRLAMSSNIGNGGTNFNMATEDFPALPGAPPSSGGTGSGFLSGSGAVADAGTGSGGQTEGSSGSASAPSFQRDSSKGGNVNNLDSGSNQLDYTGLIGGITGSNNQGGVSSLSQTRTTSTSQTSSGGGTSGSAISGDYGLLGLLSVIRMTDADRNRLALGSDLTLLGLNLNSNENLYSAFGGPFSDKPAAREPHYQLPMCYYMQPPALKTGHLSKFQLETLFYIFYALPKDVLQAYAAQELYTREWRYHTESKVWFKRATPSDGFPNNNSSPVQFIYFDINTWERRLYSNVNQNIAGGFLSEDDVRVKFSSS